MPRAAASSVLGGLSPGQFLKACWQKEPLVVRGAFRDLEDPLSPNELAGLSCEPDVDSRLVMARGGRKPWQVVGGPQRPEVLRKLPRSHWTLLVESVDRHHPKIAALASAFSFLPRWRMDDVMVSLAPVHGTVDAHIDSYDVFLIQGQGRRRWEVDRRATAEYKPGLDLRILKRFRAEESWILEPGDMLYVPPGVAHRGTTVRSDAEIALTYSVGFRAPSSADLLSSALRQSLKMESPRLFSDLGRVAVADAGELSGRDLAALRHFLVSAMDGAGPDGWPVVAGEAVTTGGGTGPAARRLTPSGLAQRLARGGTLTSFPGARVAWSRLDKGRAVFFVNGESRVLPRGQAFAAPLFCGHASPAGLRRLAAAEDPLSLALDLLRAGVLVLHVAP